MSTAKDTTTDENHRDHTDRRLRFLYKAATALETLIEQAQGEVTPEVERLLESFHADESAALDALLDYRDESLAVVAACETRIEQATKIKDGCERDIAWIDGELAKIARRKVSGQKRKSFRHGVHVVRLAKQPQYLDVDKDLDPELLPAYLRKWSEPKPAVCTIDKAAAKKALKDGETIPGMRLRRNAPKLTVE